MNRDTTKGRFAIQRKKLIFGKLYKELGVIIETFDSLPEGAFFIEFSTNFKGNNYLNSRDDRRIYYDGFNIRTPSYKLWTDMKKDIRETLVPSILKKSLNFLEDKVINYFSLLQKFKSEVTAVQVKHKKILEGHEFDIEILMEIVCFRDGTVDGIVKRIIKRHSLTDSKSIDYLRAVVVELLSSDVKDEVLVAFDEMKKNVVVTYSVLKEVIETITSKYEFGQNL